MFTKYIKFVITRLLGTGVDTLVLWICSDFIFSSSYYGVNIVSPTISFEFAVMSNFICSYYWIWRSNRIAKDTKSVWRKFLIFNISAIAGFLIKMGFLLLFEAIFGWDVIVCNLVALLISGILNFCVDILIFKIAV
ncbi:MAG: GtrA family protein [Muribaculaceae bacterium]|nr:GtrA family protein [Muribaculaceae bacterium]